jgi:hypothetical protein
MHKVQLRDRQELTALVDRQNASTRLDQTAEPGSVISFRALSIDRTGLSGVSPQDAPLFEIDDLSGETEPTTIGHGGAFQSPQWQAVFPTGRLRSPATGWKLARLKLLVRNS